MNYSTEQAARIVQVIGFGLGLFGVQLGVGSEELSAVLGAGIFVVSTVYGWVKRYQRGDLKLFGGRK